MRKRFLSLSLSLCMALALLPVTALAANEVLYVGGVNAAAGGALPAGASYDAGSNTLTLSGVSIDGYYETTAGDSLRAGIYYSGTETLHIVLTDANTILLHPSRSGGTELGTYIRAVGIYAGGDVEITSGGGGSLGFQASDITESDVIIDSKASTVTVQAECIHTTAALTIGGSAVVNTAGPTSFPIDPSVKIDYGDYVDTYSAASNASAVTAYAAGNLTIGGGAPVFTGGSVQVDGTLVMNGGSAAMASLVGGDIAVNGGALDISSIQAGDLTVAGGSLTSKLIAAANLTVTGGKLTTQPSSSASSTLKGMIELSGSADLSGGTVTVNSTDSCGIRSAYQTNSWDYTEGDFIVSGSAVVNITVNGQWSADGVSMGGSFRAAGNAQVTVKTGTANGNDLGTVLSANKGAVIADNAAVDLTGGYAALQVGSYSAPGNFEMTGGVLNAKATAATGASSGIYLYSGSVAVSGGSITAEGDAGILFANANEGTNGGFSVTGGSLKVIGAKAGVIWSGSDAAPDITEHVTVTTNPTNIQFLAGCYTGTSSYDGSTFYEYSATYVDSAVTELEFEDIPNYWPVNGIQAITFGVEPCAEHTWGDWVLTEEAACTETGVETNTCQVCGSKEARAIPALGHDLTYQLSEDETEVIAVCQREGCGYTEASPLTVLPAYAETYSTAIDQTGGVLSLRVKDLAGAGTAGLCAYLAQYDGNGRLTHLAALTAQVTEDGVLFSAETPDEAYKLFLVNDAFLPIIQAYLGRSFN